MERDLTKICAYALERLRFYGADDADCIVSRSHVDEMNVDAGEFSLLRSIYNASISMRAIKDQRKGVISINKTDEISIDEAAKQCVANAAAADEDDCLSIAPVLGNADFTFGLEEPDRDRFFDRIREYLDDVHALYPKVLIEQLIADFGVWTACFGNTNGVRFTKRGGYYSLSSMYSAHDGDKATSFNSVGMDFVSLDRKLIELGDQKKMYELCQRELEAAPYNGKFTGIAVFAPSCLDDIVDTAIHSFTGGSAILDGTSPWKDKLGQRVASEKLTFRLIPIDERIVGGERFTSEGYPTENCTVIENGVLRCFTLSEYTARKTGNKRCSTLSGCSEVVAGSRSVDEIIAGIERGLLVCRVSGGEPAGNGDFSAVAKNSFLIENGRVTRPVTETMISGNLADMLMHITDISRETVCDGSGVAPYVAFDGVTVSGS